MYCLFSGFFPHSINHLLNIFLKRRHSAFFIFLFILKNFQDSDDDLKSYDILSSEPIFVDWLQITNFLFKNSIQTIKIAALIRMSMLKNKPLCPQVQ